MVAAPQIIFILVSIVGAGAVGLTIVNDAGDVRVGGTAQFVPPGPPEVLIRTPVIIHSLSGWSCLAASDPVTFTLGGSITNLTLGDASVNSLIAIWSDVNVTTGLSIPLSYNFPDADGIDASDLIYGSIRADVSSINWPVVSVCDPFGPIKGPKPGP